MVTKIREYLILWIEYVMETGSILFNYYFRKAAVKGFMDEQLRQHAPQLLHIEATNICNAKCVFCAYPQMERRKAVMPMTTFVNTIDQYIESGGRNVSLTPIVGDPFVDPKIFERLDYLQQKPELDFFFFYTNAILMQPEKTERLLEYGGRLGIYISWGGFDRETYEIMMGVDKFEQALQHTETLILEKQRTGSGVQVFINIRCPKKKVRGHIWERFQEYAKAGLIQINFLKGYDNWAGKIDSEQLKQLGLPPLKPFKLGPCERLYQDQAILVDGKVNGCAVRDMEGDLLIGDLSRDKLSEVLRGKQLQVLIEKHETGDFLKVCKKCTSYTSIYSRKSFIRWKMRQQSHEKTFNS